MKEPRPLTLKQQRFIYNYIELSGNAVQALIKSGYKDKNPEKVAYRLLKNPIIKAEVGKIRMKQQQESEVNAAWIIDKLKKIISNPEKEENAIKAINELNKMLGTYAPEESKSSVNIKHEDILKDLK